jgi:hypothetical protein
MPHFCGMGNSVYDDGPTLAKLIKHFNWPRLFMKQPIAATWIGSWIGVGELGRWKRQHGNES